MVGCNAVTLLSKFEQVAQTVPVIPSCILAITRDADVKAMHDVEIFSQACAAQREEIVLKFSQFREDVNSTERAALQHFDSEILQRLKVLKVQADAFQVKARQFSASCLAGIVGMDLFTGTMHGGRHQTVRAPVFKDSVIQLMRRMLETQQCWEFESLAIDANVTANNCQIQLFEKFQQEARLAKEDVLREIIANNNRASLQMPFQGQLCAQITFEKSHGINTLKWTTDVAISPDGCYIAATLESQRDKVAIVSGENGEFLQYLLTGDSSHPHGVCFTPGGDTLLVTMCKKGPIGFIAEFELGSGRKVRSMYAPSDPRGYPIILHSVDSNAETIVACLVNHAAVCVFDYCSGSYLRTFECPGMGCSKISLSRDGTCVAMINTYRKFALIATLEGAVLKRILVDFMPRDVRFLRSGEVAIVGEAPEGHQVNGYKVDIYETRGTRLITSLRTNPLFSQPKLFIADDSFLRVLCDCQMQLYV